MARAESPTLHHVPRFVVQLHAVTRQCTGSCPRTVSHDCHLIRKITSVIARPMRGDSDTARTPSRERLMLSWTRPCE